MSDTIPYRMGYSIDHNTPVKVYMPKNVLDYYRKQSVDLGESFKPQSIFDAVSDIVVEEFFMNNKLIAYNFPQWRPGPREYQINLLDEEFFGLSLICDQLGLRPEDIVVSAFLEAIKY